MAQGGDDGRLWGMALHEALQQLPDQARQSPEWQAFLVIFTGVPAFRDRMSGGWLDLEKAEIDIARFREEIAGYLSPSEVYLARLAFHLFNPANPLPLDGLAGLSLLDAVNFSLAMTAIQIAYG
jgi:hypothetical protein